MCCNFTPQLIMHSLVMWTSPHCVISAYTQHQSSPFPKSIFLGDFQIFVKSHQCNCLLLDLFPFSFCLTRASPLNLAEPSSYYARMAVYSSVRKLSSVGGIMQRHKLSTCLANSFHGQKHHPLLAIFSLHMCSWVLAILLCVQ